MEALIWKTRDKEIKIKSLKELFDALVNIKQEDLDKEINLNITKEENKLPEWLEANFPKQMELIAHLKNIQEFTPQQIREQIIRDLRKII
jgi:ribosomal protein S4